MSEHDEVSDMPDSASARQPMLEHLEVLVGRWSTEATHPELPNATIRGESSFEWLEGGHFLIWRSHFDHPDIPDSISIIGGDDAGDPDAAKTVDCCTCRYFDSRGVSRIIQVEAKPGVWRMWRDWPKFSQRVTNTISVDGNAFTSNGELSEDDVTWKPDLHVTYTRIQ